jgi:hypothetical protein
MPVAVRKRRGEQQRRCQGERQQHHAPANAVAGFAITHVRESGTRQPQCHLADLVPPLSPRPAGRRGRAFVDIRHMMVESRQCS